jgi:DNA polymerase-3 subunit alpha
MHFIHLGIHSEFSVIDSIVRIGDLSKAAAKDQMPALALTDLSNLYAAVKFYKTCLGKGIKPILGSDVRVGDDKQRVMLYAMNQTGWRHLTEIVSQGFTDGLKLGTPLIERDWIFAKHDGLIVVLGASSDVGLALTGATPEKAEPILAEWQAVFGDRVYLGLTRTHRGGEDDYIEHALDLAERAQVPVVAHNDVRFMTTEDFEAHEARVCISSGYVLGDDKRPKLYSAEQYFKTQAQMIELFADIPSAIENTIEIARRCSVTLTLGKNYLPDFPVPEGYDIARYFAERSEQGLEERLRDLYPERGDDWPEIRKPYDDRLQFEIKTILDMGFPGYFLIVMDFIQWAKNNGVPVGPGRGSGAGSLVAYSLKITDLDPLAYDLLFERFLNPERVSMPDFDVDFCIAGRDRVIDYVAQKYGREAVSQIITFGTMAAKAVVRDVARVQGKSYGLADRISKLIPKTPGISLEEALNEEPQLKDIITNPNNNDQEDAAEIWEMALKLEGITRNVGKHAGGVLIAPGKITDFSAVYCDEEGARVSQFDKDDVEQIGLVKFDFLGLRNLTVIDWAMDAINARRKQEGLEALELDKLPLDDKPSYQLLQDTKTTAVFQLESTGMKKYLGKLKPSNIEDVIAMCALYRPGPLDAGMVDMYINRKHGYEEVIYDHPDLAGILGNTYGVIVYQEQVMQISQVLAGYTLGGADMLRRAMGKKKPEEMAKQREIFVTGATNRGIDPQVSGGIFDLMEKFAGYGFNKSHSAAYGVVAYHTAWLKAHYPAEFMSAVLTSEMQNTDNVVFIIDDCRGLGLTILPPNVNLSDFRFRAADPKTIVYGLGAIKGVGEAAMQSVMDARASGGTFRDLFDFCHRIDLKKANKRTLEALIRAGALDCLGIERAELMDQLPEAVQAADQARQNRESGMFDLFGEVDEVQRKPSQHKLLVWSDEVRLKGEKDTLGLYLTGHPIDVYQDELKRLIPSRLNSLTGTRRGQTTVFAGLIMDVLNFSNRIVILLDDGTGRIEVSCGQEKFQRYKELLQVEQIVVIEGEVMERDGFDRPMGRLSKAFGMNEIRAKRVNAIHIHLKPALLHPQLANQLHTMLHPFCSGDTRRIPIHIQMPHYYANLQLQLGETWWVRPEDALLRQLREQFGKNSLEIVYQQRTARANHEQEMSG